jgi:hypothetical protein
VLHAKANREFADAVDGDNSPMETELRFVASPTTSV